MAPSDAPPPSAELPSGEPVPEHERLVGRLEADAHGESYDASRSLDDAKKADDAAVVMQGDYGGSIYLTCPVRFVLCDEATLRQLLFELDTLYWNEPDGAGLYYERAPVGAGIAGGTGGGVVTEGVWIHPDIEQQGEGVRQAVESVLFGRRASLSMKPRVVVEEIAPESREITVDGRKLLRGRTLASFVNQFGGYEGKVRHPTTFERFTVSLERWRDRRPESTWLELTFVTDSADSPAD